MLKEGLAVGLKCLSVCGIKVPERIERLFCIKGELSAKVVEFDLEEK